VNKGGNSSNCKKNQQSFNIWWKNIHYQLANLWNRITTKIFDIFRIITFKKTKVFSVRSSPAPQILKKIAVRSSPDPAKLVSVLIQSCPCSSLLSCSSVEHDLVSGSRFNRILQFKTGSGLDWILKKLNWVRYGYPNSKHHCSKMLNQSLFSDINRIRSNIWTGLPDEDRTGLLKENFELD